MSADTAPAAMPGEEEIARVVDPDSWRHLDIARSPDVALFIKAMERAVHPSLVTARAILTLFAPILAEKEREIVAGRVMTQKMRELAARQKTAGCEYYDRALAAEAALAAERALLVRAKNYIVYNADSLSMNSPATLLVEEIVAAIRAGE